MTALCYEVPGTSRIELRRAAHYCHAITHLEDLPFQVDRFFEALPQLAPGWDYEIVESSQLGELHALTDADEQMVYVRDDIYERACSRHGRDRLTLAHEIAHVLFHGRKGMARAPARRGEVPAYADSEWQANCFGGELLVPSWMHERFESAWDIETQCLVSADAARVQWAQIQKLKSRGSVGADLRPK